MTERRPSSEANPVLYPMGVAVLVGLPIAAVITGNWWLAAGGPVGFVLLALIAGFVDIYRLAHPKETP